MIDKILESLGYSVDTTFDSYVEKWKQTYKGDIKDFHSYKEYNGRREVNRKRRSLKMLKKACEDWADTIFNDNVFITLDKTYQKTFDDMLKNNNFRERFSKLIEFSFALGKGALVEYKNIQNKVKINFIKAYMIRILDYSDDEILKIAFASYKNKDTIYLNIHELQNNGSWEIKNYYYKVTKDSFEKITKEKVKEKYNSPVKLFQIVKPNIVNNIEFDKQYEGISIVENAYDELLNVDVAFDTLGHEIKAGRRKTFVQTGALDFNITTDGETAPIFNDEQDEFYLMPEDAKNPDGTLIKQQAEPLRTTDLIDNLQTALNLFGKKVGLGNNYYEFKDGDVYTNTTQVVSTNSKFYKTLKKHEKNIDEVIKELAIALIYLEKNKIYDGDVTTDFDDSIIEDKEAIKKQALLERNAEIIDDIQYFQDVYDMTLQQATEFYEDILERKKKYNKDNPNNDEDDE